MLRRLLKPLLWVALVVGLVDLYRSDKTLFRRPADRLELHRAQMAHELRDVRGVALVFTADAAQMTDWVSGKPVELAGVEATKGRIGGALRFDGRRRTFAIFPVRWDELGTTFTVSLWLRLDARSPDQEILFTREPQPMGLKLDRGRMSFFMPAGERLEAAAYAFTNYGRFVHVAAAVDAAAGTVRLFENGVLRATASGAPAALSVARMALGRSSGVLVGEPLQGDVDEVIVWRRALADSDVAALTQRDEPAPAWLAPGPYRGLQRARAMQDVVRQALLMVDRFHPGRHVGPLRRADLPEVHVILSKPDQKHFTKAHRSSLASGRRIEAAAQWRGVDVVEDGRSFRARMQLDGSDGGYAPGPRRGYVLETEGSNTVAGLRRVRLAPPETSGWLGPLVETRVGRELGVPAVSNGFCRLVVNGELVGLYLYEDLETMGLPRGVAPGVFDGRVAPAAWTRLLVDGPPPIARADLERIRSEVEEDYLDLLRRDAASPYSGREADYRVRQDRKRIAAWLVDEGRAGVGDADRAARLLESFAVLGDNPAPLHVLRDLALPATWGDRVSVTWRSSDPDLITDDGRVHRPAQGGPRGVTLTAVLDDGRSTNSVSLDFRVMPRERALGALFLWASEPPGRLRRVNAAVDYLPPGVGDEPTRWCASQDGRAGLSLRGNSSLRQLKKPYGIRLSEPHGLWGSTNIAKINLVTPWRDPTYIRNRLCYDLFRSFGGAGRHDGLPLEWMEVFVNGHFRGLYEAVPPMRAEWLGLTPYRDDEEDPAVVYKAQRAAPSLVEHRMMRQVEPSRSRGHFPEAVVELQRFIEEAPRDEFAREFARRMDLDNVLDFHLLLDLSENYNGLPFDFTIHDVLARDAGPDARFFLVPYDFDTTWDARPFGRYHSRVFERLMREYPGYSERLAARWRELRAGPLRSDAVEQTVRAHQALLADYVAWDDRRWKRDPDDTYEQRVGQLIGQIRVRFAQLDQRFAASP